MATQQNITVYIGSEPDTPLGVVWVAASAEGLWALEYGVSKEEFLDTVNKRGAVQVFEDEAKVKPALEQVRAYFSAERNDFDLPIDWRGMTDFQVRVRKAVKAIPAGQTASYGQIAAQVGKPGTARAVGRVNATNPIPLVIPCHRVVGADGALTGYGGIGGIKTKEWLLDLEKS
jgi:O-6-methylguanine DNA methyltransferase